MVRIESNREIPDDLDDWFYIYYIHVRYASGYRSVRYRRGYNEFYFIRESMFTSHSRPATDTALTHTSTAASTRSAIMSMRSSTTIRTLRLDIWYTYGAVRFERDRESRDGRMGGYDRRDVLAESQYPGSPARHFGRDLAAFRGL